VPVKKALAKSATRLTAEQALVEYEIVRSKISIVRGLRVMFAHDLAELYGVETKVLMQAVCRNVDRFPDDFIFQLTNHAIFPTLSANKVWPCFQVYCAAHAPWR